MTKRWEKTKTKKDVVSLTSVSLTICPLVDLAVLWSAFLTHSLFLFQASCLLYFFFLCFFFLTECIFALWTSWKELPFVNSWLQQQFFIPGWQCTLKPTDRACLEKGNSSMLKPETRSERPASDLPSKCSRALKFYWKRDAYVWHRHSINVCWVECSKNDKGDITEHIF